MLDTKELKNQLRQMEIGMAVVRQNNPGMTDNEILAVFEGAIDDALTGFDVLKELLDGGLPGDIDEETAKKIKDEFNDQLFEFEPTQYAHDINLIYKECQETDERIGTPISTMLLEKTLHTLLSVFAGRYPSHYYAVKDSLDFFSINTLKGVSIWNKNLEI